MSLYQNWLVGVGLQSDWIDCSMVGVIYMPKPLFEVNGHINYGILSHLWLKEIILFAELIIFAVLL